MTYPVVGPAVEGLFRCAVGVSGIAVEDAGELLCDGLLQLSASVAN